MPFGIRLPRLREQYYLLALKDPHKNVDPIEYPLIFLHDKRQDEYFTVRNIEPIEIPKGTMVDDNSTAYLKTGWLKGLRVVAKDMYHPSQLQSENEELEPLPEKLIGYIPKQEFDDETKNFLKKL